MSKKTIKDGKGIGIGKGKNPGGGHLGGAGGMTDPTGEDKGV